MSVRGGPAQLQEGAQTATRFLRSGRPDIPHEAGQYLGWFPRPLVRWDDRGKRSGLGGVGQPWSTEMRALLERRFRSVV